MVHEFPGARGVFPEVAHPFALMPKSELLGPATLMPANESAPANAPLLLLVTVIGWGAPAVPAS
jgi:hypothetical protein